MENNTLAIMPLIDPSQVLFGLILGASACRPIVFPTSRAVVSVVKVANIANSNQILPEYILCSIS